MNGIISLCMILGWLAFAVQALLMGAGESRQKWTIRVPAVLLLLYGGLAFFLPFLSVSGGLTWLPPTFEWPIAKVSGVAKDSQGRLFAPHVSSGRIQVYDANKQYLHGWTIDAGGGVFKVVVTKDDLIEVFTSRGDRHYVFQNDGALLQQGRYASPTSYETIRSSQLSVYFPIPFILLPFAYPILAWFVAVCGGVTLGIMDRNKYMAAARKFMPSRMPR